MFILERIDAPVDEPVSLTELEVHLRTFASDTSEDGLLNSLISVAREWAEEYTGRALLAQKWRLTIDSQYGGTIAPMPADSVSGFTPGYYCGASSFKNGEIMLRRSPVVAITKFVSVDAAGAETDVPAEQYSLREKDSKWPRVVPLGGANWSIGTFRVEFTAGFADEDAVPQSFKSAIKLHAEAFYDRDPEMIKLLIGDDEKPGILQGMLKAERANLSIA